MNAKIDYSKYCGSLFCALCIKELKGNDSSIIKVKVPAGNGYSKVDQPICDTCGAHAIGFSSKFCFETKPIGTIIRSLLLTLFICGFFGGMAFILGPKEGVNPSTAYIAVAIISLCCSAALLFIVNKGNKKCRAIIEKIESNK